jgi:hypothetical protein
VAAAAAANLKNEANEEAKSYQTRRIFANAKMRRNRGGAERRNT